MNPFHSQAHRSASIPQPRYMYRVTFGGVVRVTTDPVEVARIRRAYPNAHVEILPFHT